MIKLKIGATVMLRSGGPPMTVVQLQEELTYVCWIVNGMLMRDAFHFNELVEIIAKDIEYETQQTV